MPNLSFEVTGVEAVARGLTPLLHFRMRIDSAAADERIEGLLLHAQIQLQCPLRGYTGVEKEKLSELFGPAEGWGRTLRNRLWGHSQTSVGGFTGSCETVLPVTCTYDLNCAAAKYFYALEGGEVSLLFLFSGSVFYVGAGQRLQVQRLSWNKECTFLFSVQVWRELMESHYPNSAWLALRRDLFDKLYTFKRRRGCATWDQAIEQLLLLDPAERAGASSSPGFITRPEDMAA